MCDLNGEVPSLRSGGKNADLERFYLDLLTVKRDDCAHGNQQEPKRSRPRQAGREGEGQFADPSSTLSYRQKRRGGKKRSTFRRRAQSNRKARRQGTRAKTENQRKGALA